MSAGAIVVLAIAGTGILLMRFRKRWLAKINIAFTNRITGLFAGWLPGFGILTHVGRKSGKVYRTPVNVFRASNGFIIALTYSSQSEWVKNVLAAGGCELKTRGKKYQLSAPKVVRDPTRRRFPFLNGLLPNSVPLLFGELFTTVLYDEVAIDPGSPKMRRSLARHLRQVKPKITKVVATHAHEEHVGNLNWLSGLASAPIYVSEMTARFLTPFKKLPWVRATIIGQPPNLAQPYSLLGETIDTQSGYLQVIPTPGHCDDHVVLYDPKEKLLLAGDAFMGSYFATPNPDVDSRKWLVSLERLMELDIEILVEGHGHIHTLRPDIPDFPGVVIREDPKVAISQKLDYLRWLREQIEAGFQEGLPVRVIEASCFPWGRRTSWESCATDECIRLLSLGHFSRTELVRSFVRTDGDQLPTVYEVRISGGE